MVEPRAQAPHDEAYRDQFTRTDRFFRQRIADIVRDGIEEGVFRDVNPERTAAMLVTIINGSMLERVTTESPEDLMRSTGQELEKCIDAHLLAEDGE